MAPPLLSVGNSPSPTPGPHPAAHQLNFPSPLLGLSWCACGPLCPPRLDVHPASRGDAGGARSRAGAGKPIEKTVALLARSLKTTQINFYCLSLTVKSPSHILIFLIFKSIEVSREDTFAACTAGVTLSSVHTVGLRRATRARQIIVPRAEPPESGLKMFRFLGKVQLSTSPHSSATSRIWRHTGAV